MKETVQLKPAIRAEIDRLISLYPVKEAALLPILHLVQHEYHCVSDPLKAAVAEAVGVPLSTIYELVTFYTMFTDTPVGKHHINVCVNMTCGLMGGESLCKYLSDRLGISPGETTADGKFTLTRTNECLADCDHAPMMQINERFHGNLTREKVDEILNKLS